MKGKAIMIDQMKKALTTGVGLALKTWAEAEAAGKEMIKKAQLSEKDAGQLLQTLKASYEKAQKKMEVQVNRLVKDVLKKADIATHEDVRALKREILALKKDLKAAATSAKKSPTSGGAASVKKAGSSKAAPAARGKSKTKSSS
jgi:polyhydroxyalkanoate synthesis regulator phasin